MLRYVYVCRPREKIHRPQTRRRRENNEDSLEKMQAIRKNMKKACEILDWLTRREQKKVYLAVRKLVWLGNETP